MKLLFNAIATKPGGGLTVLLTLLRGWRRLAAKLDITVLASDERTLEALSQSQDVDRIIPILPDSSHWRRFVWESFSLNSTVRKLAPDVVLRSNHYFFDLSCPEVVLHQNLWRFSPKDTAIPAAKGFVEGMRNWSSRRALQRAQANVFISDFMRGQAELIVPESRPRNWVIHNGIDDGLIDQALLVADRYDGRVQLAAVQDGNIQKDNATLVNTMRELVRREPSIDWHLKVAGGNGIGRFGEDFVKMSRKLRIEDRITWLGFCSERQIDNLLRESLCLIFTSVVEGFGLPPLEAMVRRCPVIACKTTAMPEIVGDAGILVGPRRADQFADSVVKLHRSPQLRSELISRGLERCKEFYSSQAASKFCEVFEHVTGKPVERTQSVPTCE